MRNYLLLFLLLTGLTFFTGKNVNAQGVTTASVNGIVTDAKGTVPGATVTITHLPTGTVYSTVTRADGRFNLPNLRVGGPYTFKITYVGYKNFTQDNITLSIGQDQKIDAKLEDNNTNLQEVLVSGKPGKVINSQRTGASETITRAQIDILPTVSRSLSDITKLTPSANSTTTGGNSFGGRSNLFNNVTVDGALFNNSFGLSNTLGGQTSSQPISLDAIDQVQVDIAPYDVRQGNFTGAGINTVVKSGTNTFKGTVYDYIRGTSLQGYDVGPTTLAKTPFSYRQTGFSLGGPIIKNKLFFFASGEQERISQPATTYVATGSGGSGAISQVDVTTLNAIANTLKTKYGYDPGPYQGYSYKTSSDKATVKIDWNIDKNNTLSAKYFYLKSYADQPASNSGIVNNGVGFGTTRAPGPATLPFYGSGYRINNNFNIGIIELDTRISSTVSNRLTAGYSALRDYRASLGSGTIPLVDIGNGTSSVTGVVTGAASATATSFGYELYTAGNLLSTNIGQFSDDLTIYAGKHEITLGTSDQIQSYTNGFAPDYNGLYTYNSASDFINGLPAAAYTVRNSALPDGSFPYAKIKAGIYSLYAQDKFHVTDNFRLTYGVRADYDAFPTSLAQNPNAAALTFQQGIHVDPSQLPKNRVQVSPRIGFNWDVNGDQTTQIRGGSGLFAGSVPFVWISNQASNNGLLFGSYTIVKGAAGNTPAQNAQLIFNPNVNANRPVGGAAANTSYELDVADPNLKYPKIWRTNLAIDQRLPGGVIATVEGAYTKDIHAIYHENLVLSDGFTTLPGVEGQIRYNSKNITPAASAATVANPSITGLYYMTNTNQGYSYFITGQLQKSFSNGLYFNAAYTHSGSQDVNDGGSTASTIWSSRPVAGNPNAANLSNSSFIQPNRIIATAAYKKDFWKNTTSTIGLEFEAANSGAVSYITSGDPNNDGATNDLMYIPKSQNDIILVADYAGDPRSATQAWNQLNNFINQDSYLSKHRGQYAQRNAVILPYFQRLDLHLAQDFYVQAGKTKNTIQVSVDIINFGNLLDKNWGLYQTSFNGFTSGTTTVLTYKGQDPTTGRPTYSFPYLDKNNLIPVTKSFINNTSQLSRYQAQIGIRYTFN
ncbi:MAG TPA: TonB-dependent receptor [Mucilaginibacter sp.]